MYVNPITFNGKPINYAKINNTVSRSAQPKAADFAWLKKRGVTDVINFRTMVVSGCHFDEKAVTEALGMKYHNIPSVSKFPTEENVSKFLDIVEGVQKNNGKVHIHCMAGADRTGMYSYIYKALNGIGTRSENEAEMIKFGHNYKRYPDLISWINKYLDKIMKTK